jgi:uncharacterized protein YndB with AHSA1/START domain
MKQWYCPKPWHVTVADIDVRAGGKCHIVMTGPNGEENDIHGQYLEVADQSCLTFSDAFVGDWIPSSKAPFMTGYVVLTDGQGDTTTMEWGARHWLVETYEEHKAMGFDFGWNAAADQLDALAQSLKGS